MIDKTVASVEEAVAGIHDGATIMIGGFGRAGQPVELIVARRACEIVVREDDRIATLPRHRQHRRDDLVGAQLDVDGIHQRGDASIDLNSVCVGR